LNAITRDIPQCNYSDRQVDILGLQQISTFYAHDAAIRIFKDVVARHFYVHFVWHIVLQADVNNAISKQQRNCLSKLSVKKYSAIDIKCHQNKDLKNVSFLQQHS